MSFFPGELDTVGVRHAFDLLGMWTSQSGATQACLVTGDEIVRRPLQDRLSIPLVTGPADIALYPFSLEQTQPAFNASIIAGCFRNSFSYRRLVHPSLIVYSIPRLTTVLQVQGYQLEKLIGIYPPAFLFWWFLSIVANTRFPAKHFEWEQTAMNYLSTSRQPAMTFSHMIVFYARRLDS